jgi:hypothetical protein
VAEKLQETAQPSDYPGTHFDVPGRELSNEEIAAGLWDRIAEAGRFPRHVGLHFIGRCVDRLVDGVRLVGLVVTRQRIDA